MSKRYPWAKWVLPAVINPPDSVCYIVHVPNERQHIGAFLGAIANLASATKWADDPDHKARDVALVWRDIFDSLIKQDCNQLCATGPGIGADGEEQLIRQNPDNPCELQTSVDGTNWCTFADFSLCIPAGSQPGSGTEQPQPGGGEACYHAAMAANNKWLLPTQVNAGDTIAITLANGAGHDGGVSPWQCPNGQQFFLGSCVGLTGTDGSDPAPSIAHMRLIAEIDGTFYDAYNGSITVPGGVVSADVVFQINDADLSDNSGSYTFDVCVTNNAETTFDHLFDFSTGDGGWSTTVYAPANPNLLAHYDAGNCWETVEYYVIAAPNNRGVNCNIFRDIPARTITDIEITYERDTVGNDSFGNTPLMQIIYNVTGVQLNTNIANSGVESYHVSTPGVTHLGVSFQAGGRTDGTPCTSHGKITQIRVKGIGSDPF